MNPSVHKLTELRRYLTYESVFFKFKLFFLMDPLLNDLFLILVTIEARDLVTPLLL